MQVTKVLFSIYKSKDQNYTPQKKQKQDILNLFKNSVAKAFDFSEKEKKQLDESIAAKIKLGAKLTPKELQYLQKTNPKLYLKIMMIQKKKEALEQKLKNCNSKKEVNEVINTEINLIREKDPDKELKLRAIMDTAEEFKKSDYYNSLPETDSKS
jgi:hypothetical protein